MEIKVNRKKLKKLRKDFNEFRHNFSKKETYEYRKTKKYKKMQKNTKK